MERNKGQWFIIKRGKRFGKLVVLSPSSKKIFTKNGIEIKGRLAEFQCDCGKKVVKPYRNAENGRILSCGCFRFQEFIKSKSPNWKGFEEISGEFWSALKKSAENREIKINIDIKYAWEKFIEQDRKCALSGEPLFFAISNSKKYSSNASIDRIDSSKGYIKGNIQWVTKKINRMKMDLDEQEFLKLCKNITLYQESCSLLKQ